MRKELLPFVSDITRDLEQHRLIYEKICEQDSDGAREATHHHLRMGLELAKKSGLIFKEYGTNAG